MRPTAPRIDADQVAPRSRRLDEVAERKAHAAVVIQRVFVIGVERQRARVRLGRRFHLTGNALRRRLPVDIPERLHAVLVDSTGLTFDDRDTLVGRESGTSLFQSTRPDDLDRIGDGERTEPERLDETVL